MSDIYRGWRKRMNPKPIRNRIAMFILVFCGLRSGLCHNGSVQLLDSRHNIPNLFHSFMLSARPAW